MNSENIFIKNTISNDLKILIFEAIRNFIIYSDDFSEFSGLKKKIILKDCFKDSNINIFCFNLIKKKSSSIEQMFFYVLKFNSQCVLLEIKEEFQISNFNKDLESLISELEFKSFKNGVIFYKSSKLNYNFMLKVEYHNLVVNEISFNCYIIR